MRRQNINADNDDPPRGQGDDDIVPPSSSQAHNMKAALVNRCLPLAVVDRHLNICHCNDPLRELLRLGDLAMPHQPQFVSHNCEHEFARVVEDVINGDVRHVHAIGLTAPTGDIVCVDAYLFPASHQEHDLALGVFCKSTETVSDQERRKDTYGRIVVGELVNVVAHELNNALASVLGFSQFLAKENSSAASDLRQVSHAAQLCQHLVAKLLTYTRKQRPARSRVDINDLIARQLSLLAGELASANVFVELRMEPGLPAVNADPNSLKVVVTNVIANARQSMPDGGTLNIETSAGSLEREGPAVYNAACVAERVADLAEPFVQVRFIDTGSGISPAKLPRVFEPFFTTLGDDFDGIGLSISRSIIGKHGGAIRVEHTSPRGTTIVVRLPAAQPPSIFNHADHEQRAAPATSKKRVLLSEDDISCCRLIEIALTREGHTVDVTHDGEQAMAKLDAHTYDVILVDINMARLDGRKLYELISREDPQLARKIIFITGDIMNDDVRKFLSEVPNTYLMKPFDIDKLSKAVQEM